MRKVFAEEDANRGGGRTGGRQVNEKLVAGPSSDEPVEYWVEKREIGGAINPLRIPPTATGENLSVRKEQQFGCERPTSSSSTCTYSERAGGGKRFPPPKFLHLRREGGSGWNQFSTSAFLICSGEN